MYLSSRLVRWSIDRLRENCHPFIGITFLASKKVEMPVGTMIQMSLDAVTKSHLDQYHRLDPKSEFYFQPFKSNQSTFWIAADYSSSGLQSINTRTFSDAFLHPRGAPHWGFVDDYISRIEERVNQMRGHGQASLAAIAIWVGKELQWAPDTDLDVIISHFRKEFGIEDEETMKLFDSHIVPSSTIEVTSEQTLDLKALAYEYSFPPDAPSQTEGTLTSISLVNVGPAEKFHLDFGDRLTLVAGDNGLGKSFLLDTAWWALTGTWASHPAYPLNGPSWRVPSIEYSIKNNAGQALLGKCEFDWLSHSWQHLDKRPSVAALGIYTRVDGSFAISDAVRGQLQTTGSRSLSVFDGREVWEGKAGEIEGLLRDWVTWQLSSDTEPFAMLSRVLEHLSPEDIGPLVPGDPVRIPGDPRRIPTIDHVYGSVPVLFASAGVQRILQLAYLIIWSWQEHLLASQQVGLEPYRKMVILIDELEAHLHPKWQRLVLPSLMSVGKLLSEELEVQVIAATHSPMVLASVEEEFSKDSDLLAHLSLVDGSISLERLEFYKYGDVSAWLMSPVFGLSHARSQAAEKAIEDAKLLQFMDDPSIEAIREVTSRLKSTLAPDDKFWSRWIYFAKKFGESI